jgi:hypothetical protein
MNNIPFDGSTTHDADYREWELAQTQPIVPERSTTHSSDGRNFTTTQHTYHDKKESTRAAPFRPKRGTFNQVPFDGSTTYDEHYREFQVTPPQSFSPERKVTEMPDHRTFATTQQAHTGRTVAPPKPIAPSSKSFRGVPFDGSTTYDENYQEWHVAPPQPIVPERNMDPTPDGRNFTTTQHTYHDKKESIRSDPFKPAWHPMNNIPFDGSTTHDAEYREWELPSTKSFKPHHDAPNNPDYRAFDTTQGQHTGELGPRSKPFAPDYSYRKHDDGRDFRSQQQIVHDEKHLSPCPVTLLEQQKQSGGATNGREQQNRIAGASNGRQRTDLNTDRMRETLPDGRAKGTKQHAEQRRNMAGLRRRKLPEDRPAPRPKAVAGWGGGQAEKNQAAMGRTPGENGNWGGEESEEDYDDYNGEQEYGQPAYNPAPPSPSRGARRGTAPMRKARPMNRGRGRSGGEVSFGDGGNHDEAEAYARATATAAAVSVGGSDSSGQRTTFRPTSGALSKGGLSKGSKGKMGNRSKTFKPGALKAKVKF